jgi:hypothetical protein
MIDISDGLLAEARHLAESSHVAIDVHREAFEVAEPLHAVAAATGADPLSFASVTPDPLDARHEPLLQGLQADRRDLVLGPVPPVADGPVDADRVAALLLLLRSPHPVLPR